MAGLVTPENSVVICHKYAFEMLDKMRCSDGTGAITPAQRMPASGWFFHSSHTGSNKTSQLPAFSVPPSAAKAAASKPWRASNTECWNSRPSKVCSAAGVQWFSEVGCGDTHSQSPGNASRNLSACSQHQHASRSTPASGGSLHVSFALLMCEAQSVQPSLPRKLNAFTKSIALCRIAAVETTFKPAVALLGCTIE